MPSSIDQGTVLAAVLLFHAGGEWDNERRALWKQLTGRDEATTRALCDAVREVVGGGERLYLVWSNEHGAWWRPGRQGYTRSLAEAGRYTHAQALDICERAIPGTSDRIGMLPEIPVAEADVQEMLRHFHEAYPVARRAWE
jgi:hypothetical protein